MKQYEVTYEILAPIKRVRVQVQASDLNMAKHKALDGEGLENAIVEGSVSNPQIKRLRHVQGEEGLFTHPLDDFMKNPNGTLVSIHD